MSIPDNCGQRIIAECEGATFPLWTGDIVLPDSIPSTNTYIFNLVNEVINVVTGI